MDKQKKNYLFLQTFLDFLKFSLPLIFIFSFQTVNSQTINRLYNTESKKTEFYLTEEELAFITMHPILNVALDPNWTGFEEYSKKNQANTGYNIYILNYLADKIGIKLNYVHTKNYEESIELLKNHKVDLISGFLNNDLIANYADFTEPAYSVPIVLISATGHYPLPQDTIYITDYPESLQKKIKQQFPENLYNYKFAENTKNLLDIFNSKKTNYIIKSGYREIDTPTNRKNNKVFFLHLLYEHTFGISKEDSLYLLPIFNKAINSLTDEDFTILIYENELSSHYSQMEYDLKSNKVVMTIFYVLISITALILCISIILLFMLKKRSRSIEYDSVTNIPSFNKFEKDAQNILKKSSPGAYMLLSINIDNFRFVNESLGVSKGNILLSSLSRNFEKFIDDNELLCRFYADDFILLLKNPKYYWLVEERVCEIIDIPDSIKKILPQQYNLTFTTSVYYIDNTQEPIESMVTKARLAAKMNKTEYASNRVVEFTSEMNAQNEWNREITLSMNKGMENNEFEVYYQPKIRFSDEKIIGAEALIRWNNPEKGFLQPGSFIPLFEDNGFIENIDKYVFSSVCVFLDSWNTKIEEDDSLEPLTISFNLSRHHLSNPNLIKQLKQISSEYNIGKNHIEVELTESIMLDNQKKIIKIMNEIKKAGFTVSIDDFGSGYSSLNLLKDMPADVLKLDKEFLSSVPENEKENIIIISIIEMAKKLHITTVAEGIETKVQADLLKEVGCDIAQGFYYAKPMPEKEFITKLLESGKQKINVEVF